MIERKYTPISAVDFKGTLSLLIKIYRPNDHPKFPEGGKLTPWMESLQLNDTMYISGPYGRLEYKGKGQVTYHNIYTG